MEIAGFYVNISMLLWLLLASIICIIIYKVYKVFVLKIVDSKIVVKEEHAKVIEKVERTFMIIRWGMLSVFLILLPVMLMFFGVDKSTDAHDRIRSPQADINYAQPTKGEIEEANKEYKSSEYEKLNKQSEERRKKSKESYEQAIRDSVEDGHQN